jgi:hypothetical protein
MEFMTQEDCPRSLVHLEEGFDGDPQLTGHLSGVVHGHVEDRFRDKLKNPIADTNSLPTPRQGQWHQRPEQGPRGSREG